MRLQPASLQLRERTDDLHRRLDSTSILAGIVEPGLTVKDYALALDGMARSWDACLAPLPPFEADFAHADSAWVDPDWYALRSLLNEDLKSLGKTCFASPNGYVPKLEIDPGDRDQLAGMAYVLNGSRLGASLIYRKLLEHADPAIHHATRHFAAAASLGQNWRAFKQRLDEELVTPSQIEAACLAAAMTYQVWLDMMVRLEVPRVPRISARA